MFKWLKNLFEIKSKCWFCNRTDVNLTKIEIHLDDAFNGSDTVDACMDQIDCWHNS